MSQAPEDRLHLVVARYREDASWTGLLPYPSFVYDKSGAPGVPPDLALPNIGREAHTYLTHILRHYERLPEYVFLTQADPFAHTDASTPQRLAERLARDMRLDVRLSGYANYKIRCDGLGRPHDMHSPNARSRWAGAGKDIPVARVYAELFAGPVPESFLATCAAGLMLVHKTRILARPAGFYARALGLVTADPRDEGNTGHALERLWHLVFNGKSRLNHPTYPDV